MTSFDTLIHIVSHLFEAYYILINDDGTVFRWRIFMLFFLLAEAHLYFYDDVDCSIELFKSYDILINVNEVIFVDVS